MKSWILFILCQYAIAVLANDEITPDSPSAEPPPPKIVWTADCEIKKIKLQVAAKSLSGDEGQSDMKIFLAGNDTQVEVPIDLAQFVAIPPTSKRLSVCTTTPGVVVKKNRLLFLVGKNAKPDLDRITAILVDSESMSVLDTKENISAYLASGKNKIFLKKISNGIGALAAQGWKKNAKTESHDNLFMGWINISVENDKILAKWEMETPNSHKPYEFKTQ